MTFYVAKHKNGNYFGERGYGQLTSKINHAMICEQAGDFLDFLTKSKSEPEDFEIIKVCIFEIIEPKLPKLDAYPTFL
jgi:hypothetical protein